MTQIYVSVSIAQLERGSVVISSEDNDDDTHILLGLVRNEGVIREVTIPC
jgi:hypothetical protein